jgi:hypothetical protein
MTAKKPARRRAAKKPDPVAALAKRLDIIERALNQGTGLNLAAFDTEAIAAKAEAEKKAAEAAAKAQEKENARVQAETEARVAARTQAILEERASRDAIAAKAAAEANR